MLGYQRNEPPPETDLDIQCGRAMEKADRLREQIKELTDQLDDLRAEWLERGYDI